MLRKSLNFKGLTLSYLDSQKPGAGTLLFAHANGYSAGCYNYYFKRLSAEYRILALDFSGHGESEGTLDFETWDFYKEQLLALLEQESPGKVVGIGHSLGGASLLRAVQAAPEHFSQIIALDPVTLSFPRVLFNKLFGNPKQKASRVRRAKFKSLELVRRAYGRSPAFSEWEPEMFEDYLSSCLRQNGEGVELCCSPELETKNFSSSEFGSLLRYRKIKSVVRIVIPAKYEVCPPGMAKKIIQGNRDSSLHLEPGVGHLFPFEKPNWTLQQIQMYL